MSDSQDQHALAPRLGGHQQAGRSGNEPELSGARPHIFIVDDNAPILPMLEVMLHHHGLRGTCVEDGYQALEMLPTMQPDVLIADLLMPGLSGLDVLEAARQMPHLAHIPMFLSTYGGGIRRNHEEVLRLNVCVIDLPFMEFAEFCDMLRETIGEYRRTGSFYALGRLNR